jgi:hypothetical protein
MPKYLHFPSCDPHARGRLAPRSRRTSEQLFSVYELWASQAPARTRSARAASIEQCNRRAQRSFCPSVRTGRNSIWASYFWRPAPGKSRSLHSRYFSGHFLSLSSGLTCRASDGSFVEAQALTFQPPRSRSLRFFVFAFQREARPINQAFVPLKEAPGRGQKTVSPHLRDLFALTKLIEKISTQPEKGQRLFDADDRAILCTLHRRQSRDKYGTGDCLGAAIFHVNGHLIDPSLCQPIVNPYSQRFCQRSCQEPWLTACKISDIEKSRRDKALIKSVACVSR